MSVSGSGVRGGGDYPIYPRIMSNYYGSLTYASALDSNAALGANTMGAIPYPIPRDIIIDRIAVDIQTLDAAGHLRLGIYDDSAGYPNALIVDGGATGVAAATIQTVTPADTRLYGGRLYWIAAISDSNVLRIWATAAAVNGPDFCLGQAANISTPVNSITVAQAYGALPATFTGGGAYGTTAYALGVRVKSVP